MYLFIISSLFILSPENIFTKATESNLFPAIIQNGSSDCPAGLEAEFNASVREGIMTSLGALDLGIPNLAIPNCPCAGTTQPLTQIAHFNLSDPAFPSICPSDWLLVTEPVRGCTRQARSGTSCSSATFAASGLTYSQVCGRIHAVQTGQTEAFSSGIFGGAGIDDPYVDGVSVTVGMNPRQHIWSFASTIQALDISEVAPIFLCPCSSPGVIGNNDLPSFVGDNFFCDTGNQGGTGDLPDINNPLWDGEGCAEGTACCDFNSPPWFCATLPEPTSEALEVRICLDVFSDGTAEELVVTFLDLFVN